MILFGNILILTGSVLMIISAMGCLKYRNNILQALHAAAVGDSGGLMLILLGIITLEGLSVFSIKIILLIAIIMLSFPTSTHLLAKTSLMREKK
jgi:multicomponent Na+:H+ antiporter subunit G